MEQPYGVGFSLVDDGFEAVSGDDAAVADFDATIRSESFGGHYMPLTAVEIMKNNELEHITPKINLAGFMVGNHYTNYYENTIGAVEAFYGHGLMRNDIYETWAHFCFGDETAMDDTHCKMLYIIGYYEYFQMVLLLQIKVVMIHGKEYVQQKYLVVGNIHLKYIL